jgi:hypothetical protein
MYMYPIKGFRPFHKTGRFISEAIYYFSKTKARHFPYDVSFLFYEAWLCYLTIVIRYFRGLTLFSLNDKPHCTTMYMYPIKGFRPFHKTGRFISETIYYFKNIKRY